MIRDTGEVATYTEINRVCIRDGYTPSLRVWYYIRYTDHKGNGWVTREQFLTRVGELGLTRKRAKQLLAKGNGLFWNIATDGRIFLVGLSKLSEKLGLETDEGYRVYIPTETLCNIKVFNAYAYATWFAKNAYKHIVVRDGKVHPDWGKTISRTTINKLFNINRDTQISYERLAEMDVEEQVAVYKVNTTEDIENVPFTERFYDGHSGGIWYDDIDNDGVFEVIKQIPNRFASTLPFESHRKRFRTGNALSSHGGQNHQYKRKYFTDKQAAERAISKGRAVSGDTFVRTNTSYELIQSVPMRAWSPVF